MKYLISYKEGFLSKNNIIKSIPNLSIDDVVKYLNEPILHSNKIYNTLSKIYKEQNKRGN